MRQEQDEVVDGRQGEGNGVPSRVRGQGRGLGVFARRRGQERTKVLGFI